MKTWTGTVRLRGGRIQGEVVEVRITEGLHDSVLVEHNTGTDAHGATRWLALSPRQLDQASLCAALVQQAGA